VSASPRIEAALFDFGGVFTASPFAAAEGLGPRVLEIVFGPYDRDTDHPWHRLERGELAWGAARDQIIALGRDAGVDSDPLRVFGAMGSGAGVRPRVVESVRRLRGARVRTALVTNNVGEFRTRWRELIPVDELFELVVDSSEVGVRKPDPTIFRLALEGLGVSAERSVFLDDHPGNVAAARSIGLRSILVEEDPDPALAELDALILEPGR
jgi:putative hydrolase of the HAD superfamily